MKNSFFGAFVAWRAISVKSPKGVWFALHDFNQNENATNR